MASLKFTGDTSPKDDVAPITPASKPTNGDAAGKPKALPSKRLQDGEFARREYRASVESDTPWERVLDSGYWFHVAPRLRAGDIIEAVRDDLGWYGKLIVMQALGNNIQVAPLSFAELDAVAPADLSQRSGYRVENLGLSEQYAVFRIADSHKMQSGFDSAELAHAYVHNDLIPRATKRGFG